MLGEFHESKHQSPSHVANECPRRGGCLAGSKCHGRRLTQRKKEWFTACKGGAPATCNFDYSGPLSETVLLGNVAYRAAGSFTWEAANIKASGNKNVAQYVRTEFRKGWEA